MQIAKLNPGRKRKAPGQLGRLGRNPPVQLSPGARVARIVSRPDLRSPGVLANRKKMKLKLNLFPVVPDMEEKMAAILQEAVEGRASIVEIAYGTAAESVKKRILNFLNKKENRQLYSRLEKTDKGWGRIYLHFRWK